MSVLRKYKFLVPFRGIRISWRSILQGLKNFWKYRKIIWNDRDWDFSFMLEMAKFKLSQARRCQEEGNHKDSPKIAKRIRICELLLDRIIKDDYANKEYEESCLGGGPVWDESEDGLFTIGLSYSEEEQKLFKIYMKKADYLRSQDEKMLAKILIKYYRRIWD